VSSNKLEFKITHDVQDQKVNMGDMSIEVSHALLTLLKAMTRIVELTPNNKNLRICVKQGSAVVSIQGTSVETVQKNFSQIVKKKSSNKDLIEEWRRIQTLFSTNGIRYEAAFFEGNKSTSIVDDLKSSTQFRAKKKSRPPVATNIIFLSGKLIAVGGKFPNIHIDDQEDNRITISCTEVGANKAKAFLYKTILLSAWSTKTTGKDKLEMCDSYWENQRPMFSEFQEFIQQLKKAPDEIESLKLIHYKCQDLLKMQDFKKYRKFLRLFNNERSDINVLKTLLIVSRSFATQENIQPILIELDLKFRKKLEKIK
jgi:hypothetical protein